MYLSRHRLKYYIKGILSTAALWVMIALFLVYIKFNDIPDKMLAEVYAFKPWMTKRALYEMALAISALIGVVMGMTHIFLYPMIIKTRNFLINVSLRILLFTTLTLGTSALFFFFSGLPALDISKSPFSLLTPAVLGVFLYLVFIEIIVGVMITLRTNLGRDYIKKLIRNAYFDPKEEYRVFMFTDLKNSTAMAENMGSLTFSRLIQDCFREFSNAALDSGAEIYQFVGDEVVTTWNVKKGFNYLDCISLHFELCELLASKRKYFMDRYGVFPEFRSSVHIGHVTAALVGEFKTEIAYHGRVLNLCSRLQVVCRDYNSDLVVSEDFYHMISAETAYHCYPITDIELKGISEKQHAYVVKKAS